MENSTTELYSSIHIKTLQSFQALNFWSFQNPSVKKFLIAQTKNFHGKK